MSNNLLENPTTDLLNTNLIIDDWLKTRRDPLMFHFGKEYYLFDRLGEMNHFIQMIRRPHTTYGNQATTTHFKFGVNNPRGITIETYQISKGCRTKASELYTQDPDWCSLMNLIVTDGLALERKESLKRLNFHNSMLDIMGLY